MKIQLLSATYNWKVYRIHKIFGFLLEYDFHKKTDTDLPDNINVLYKQIANPYLLNPGLESRIRKYTFKNSIIVKTYARLLTFLCLRSFLFVRILSKISLRFFNTAEEAIIFYRRLYPKEQRNLCLPRSLFAACTSKTFKKEGTLFIVVFLPSRAMHAWIIEDGKQPDFFDDIWICYQPLAIMYKN